MGSVGRLLRRFGAFEPKHGVSGTKERDLAYGGVR